MRPWRRLLAAALVVLALTTSGAVVDAAPGDGTSNRYVARSEELRVAIGSFAGDLADPIDGGVAASVYQAPMFDHLLSFDRQMNLVPALAESWTVSADGRRYRFKLREDVFWHDGTRFDSRDVVHHFTQRLREGTAPYIAPFLAALDSVRADGPYAVEFRLREPWPDFLAHLSPGNTAFGAITPRDYSMRVGRSGFAAWPIGTGPFRLVERVRGQSYRYEAVAHPFRPRPGFRGLRVILVPEESTRLAMLKRGDIDIAEISPDSINWLSRDGQRILRIRDSFMTFVGFIGTWDARARRPTVATGDPEVRRALGMAIDREALVRHLLSGAGSPAAVFPLFRDGYAWDPQLLSRHAPVYDPTEARRLLQRAAKGRRLKVTIYAAPLPGLSWASTLAEVIADYWRKVGVDVEVVATELGASLPLFYTRPDRAIGNAFIYRTTRSVFPIGLIQNYVVSEGRSQFAFVDWDDRYAALNGLVDPSARESGFKNLIDDLANTHTILPLFNMDVTYAASPRVGNWAPVNGWPSIGLSLEYFRPIGREGT